MNMDPMKAHNTKLTVVIFIINLSCLLNCSKIQDPTYHLASRKLSQTYSPKQNSLFYPPINTSGLNYMHYGQSQNEDYALSINAVDPDQQDFREDRLLSPFTLVRFPNVMCVNDNNLLMGTCCTFWECWKGVSGASEVNLDWGSCASGFGICCTSVLGCGSSSSNNNTYLRSPGYPNTVNSGFDCQQTITIEEDICQLRLEIEDLSLNYPDSTGTCTTDFLTVSQDTKFDRLCGVTKNNHFYLDVMHSMSSQVDFNFHVDGSRAFDRSWSIKVTKICCHSDEEVPRGCGQYYTGTSGTIKGLNEEAPDTDDYVLSNLNYAACVRMERGYCKNTYTEEGWIPACPDIFERPGKPDGSTNVVIEKCVDAGVSNLQPSYSYSFLSPHLFKLDTTISTSNIHRNDVTGPNYGGSYNIQYQQTKC